MGISELGNSKSSRFKPWSFENIAMAPNILLMCKLLVMLILAHHFYYKLDDPFIPFIKAFDYFNTTPGIFKTTLRIVFIIALSALFLNLYVRTSCIVLGSIIFIQQLASIPHFENHTFVVGCVLLLAGLSHRKHTPILLILQLSLIYFGAFINKILDVDWINGVFVDNWLSNARQNPPYLFISEMLPEKWLALFLSWVAMLNELSISIILLLKKYRSYTIWIILFFHTVLFTFTSSRFGHFYEDILIILLAFLLWPKGQISIEYKKSISSLTKLYNLLDWDKKFRWALSNNNNKYWLQLKTSTGELYTNYNAVRKLLTSTPSFFILLFCFDAFIILLFYNERAIVFILNLIIIWSLFLFFLPMIWSKLFKSK
ncbi:HTTM domain-containing protein [Olleya sp. AH-315-F22]|nr:HTTM domain-containing protein [Olleya sp. AH-315-F22]